MGSISPRSTLGDRGGVSAVASYFTSDTFVPSTHLEDFRVTARDWENSASGSPHLCAAQGSLLPLARAAIGRRELTETPARRCPFLIREQAMPLRFLDDGLHGHVELVQLIQPQKTFGEPPFGQELPYRGDAAYLPNVPQAVVGPAACQPPLVAVQRQHSPIKPHFAVTHRKLSRSLFGVSQGVPPHTG